MTTSLLCACVKAQSTPSENSAQAQLEFYMYFYGYFILLLSLLNCPVYEPNTVCARQ